METEATPTFSKWLDGLKDQKAVSKIFSRIARIELGLLGDIRTVGDGVSEIRIDYGPGYRVYFTFRGGRLVILLAGGTKESQKRDIAKAKKLAAQIP